MADQQCTRVCVECDQEFAARSRDTKFCGDKCAWQAYWKRHGDRLRSKHRAATSSRREDRRRPRACPQCNRTFKPKTSRTVHCSRRCIYRTLSIKRRDIENARRRNKSAKRRESLPTKPCLYCKRVFRPKRRSNAMHCSGRCSIGTWGRQHPEVAARSKHARRARLNGAVSERVDRLVVFARAGWRCVLCGRPTPRALIGTGSLQRPTLDHIVPLSRGGSHTYANVQCACLSCNSRKSTKTIGQLRMF